MPTPLATVAGLRFEYPGVLALDGVSFELEPGSVTALVGPNGAGKSTLLRCIAGLDMPVAGAIRIGAVDVIESPRDAHRDIGYLSDFFGVYESLSVRRCLAHAAAVHGLDDASLGARVEDTARSLGLADRLDVAAGTLSRGLRQRLAIGQAIIHKPRLLLLDEPAAGLDPEARHALASLFLDLKSAGMTLVVSSHILAELDEYSTHMLVLRAGRAIEHGPLGGAASGKGARLRVEVASGEPPLGGVLSALGIAAADLSERHAEFDWEGDAASQAQLLRRLLDAGVAVSSFAEVREDLHRSYLRTVAEGPR